ncbi:MAG: hypothetical protein ACLFT0_16485 [Spirulinaceae cyanobacterium]
MRSRKKPQTSLKTSVLKMMQFSPENNTNALKPPEKAGLFRALL